MAVMHLMLDTQYYATVFGLQIYYLCRFAQCELLLGLGIVDRGWCVETFSYMVNRVTSCNGHHKSVSVRKGFQSESQQPLESH